MSAEERESIMLRLSHLLEPRNEIVFAYLLGSFQRGRPFRDIDIAVFLEPSRLQQNEELLYRFRLMDELERAVGYPIDIQLINNAPCGFRYNALQGALLLSRDESLRAKWVLQTMQEYLDFEPSFNRIAQTWLNQQQSI